MGLVYLSKNRNHIGSNFVMYLLRVDYRRKAGRENRVMKRRCLAPQKVTLQLRKYAVYRQGLAPTPPSHPSFKHDC